MDKVKFAKTKKVEKNYSHYRVTVQERIGGDLYCSIYLYKTAKDEKPTGLDDVTIPHDIFKNNWSKSEVVDYLKENGHL